MKSKRLGLRRDPLAAAIALACGGAIGVTTGVARAQEPPEEITVTGTRIQRTSGFTTAVPVTAVTATDLVTLEPGSTMAEQLDQLPQFYQTQSAQRGSGTLFGGGGRSVIDMRSMGPQRTLVLLDGARLAPADRDGSVHVDNIPTALLSQVEIVTGGASAAYGADALAGVTNFRLNREYDGLDFGVGIGQNDDGLGDTRSFTVAFGTEVGERSHVIASAEHQKIDQIDYDPLELGDWFQRYGIVANPEWSPGRTDVPMRLVLPNVYSRSHTPAGRIGTARNQTGGTVAGFSLAGQTFTDDGTGVRPFSSQGAIIGGATGNQSGGTEVIDGMTEAERANRAFDGGPYGAEVVRSNVFLGYTFDANEGTRYWVNLLGGRTESNGYDQRGIPHLASPWTTEIFVDNPFLPASVRQAMIAEGVNSFVIEKQGQWLGQPGNWNDDEQRRSRFDSWTLQLGLDKDLGSNWQMQARIQRGATDRVSTVENELRVDREMLAIDAVEVYTDRRDADGDGVIDLVAEADRGTGDIICNVQRYNPTPGELALAVQNVRVPAAQGDDALGNGDPDFPVPIPSPVGPDAIDDCVPMNVFGQGNVSPEAAAYVVSPKSNVSAVTQEFAEILFTGDIYDGYGPGAFSMAVGATYREQWFWQRGLPRELMAYGPPLNVPSLGIRGIQGGFTRGSPNLHEFSTVPAISGGYDVWEVFTEFNLPLWESPSGVQRLELDLSGRHSDYSTSGGIVSYKAGINLQIAEFLRFRGTVSRDVREATFAERFDVQGGGGSIQERAVLVNGVPVPDPSGTLTTFQITATALGSPDLKPEKADTVTAGFVVQPRDTGLQFSVDWYDIDLSDAIAQLGNQRIVDECRADPTSFLCGLISRDATTNAVVAVRNPWLNVAAARVRGLDYELLWNRETDWFASQDESLTLRFLAGRLLEDSTTVLGSAPVDFAGQLGQPDFKALAALRYQVGRWGVNLQQRYVAETGLNFFAGQAITALQFEPGRVAGPNQFTLDDATVQSKSYTDLTLTYDGELAGGQTWELSLAVSNLFDVDPPVIPSFDQRFSAQSNLNGFNTYDVYGRRFLLGFRYRL